MKRVLPVLALSLAVFALTPVFSASAVPTVVVRPGHLAGWVATSGTKASYGRWDTGPAKALGQGSLHLLAPTKDRLQMTLSSPVNLAGFTASFAVNGSGYASFYVQAPGGESARMTPDSSSRWSKVNAMTYAHWQWDCDSNGSFESNGTIAGFRQSCSSTVSAFGFMGARGTSWVDAAKLGPAGDVKLYNFEPPTARISDAQLVEGNSGWKPMHFVVRLSGPNQDKAEVKFATSGVIKGVHGRACACEDFSFNIAVLKIKARATSGVISIRIAGDTVPEPNETFTVRLSTHLNCFPTRAVGVGTIVNDDP